MQRECDTDHAADAGVGAQALLGLSKIRQETNDRSQTIANLSGAHNLQSLSQPCPPLIRLGIQPTLDNPLHSSINVPPFQFSQPRHEAPKEEPRIETKSNASKSTLDDTAPKLPVPRLPSISNTEGRTHSTTFPPIAAPPNVSESPANGLPRLASIAEWASTRTSPLPAAVPALPGFNTLPAIHGAQPALPSLPSQTRREYAAPTWVNSALPTLRQPYATAETSVHHSYHLASPGMYATPAPPPPLQTSVGPSYYYQPGVSAQYPSLPPTLPHLRPPAPPSASMNLPSIAGPTYLPSMTSPVLPPPTLGHLPPPSSNLNAASLPPIVNGLGKPISGDERMVPPAGDTLTQRASVTQLVNSPEVPPSLQPGIIETKNPPIRKSVFRAPASSGRGFINLMNPTDTLADVASSSPPLPVKKTMPAQISKPKPTANMRMARELFGSSSKDLLRPSKQKSCSITRKDDENKTEKIHSVPNGNSRHARTDLLASNIDSRTTNSTTRLGNADNREHNKSGSPQLGVKKENGGSQKIPESNSSAHQDNDKSSRRSSLGDRHSSDSSGEVTRCPCGSKADCGVMICCDQCNTWQHRICMGFRRKSDVPDNYYCNICRPEEMRPGCVAHPEYFELVEMEGKDVHCDPILYSVKPLELRRQFSADLKAKREGSEALRRSHLFRKYAMMYRAQFGKDRASVIEGLVVLTELKRSEVEERLEEAIKKTKKDGESLDMVNGLRKKSSVPNSTHSNKTHGLQPLARPSAKRGRPPGSLSENATEKLSTPKGMSSGASPDKEFGSGDRNRLSREERKMQQVLGLFARLEEREREKKRPRLGEPSGSPRSASFASPRPIDGISSRSGISPNTNVNLTPALGEVDLNADQRNTSGEITKSNVRSPVPKRERSTKDRKEHRRKEERGESSGRNNLLSRRRERQVLSSSSYRKRGKSRSRGVTESDPRFQVKVHIPGPSVIGSKLVPAHRRSRLDNLAIEEEKKKMSFSSNAKSKKERVLLTSKKLNDASYLPKVPPRYHPLRKRFVESAPQVNEILDKNGDVKLALNHVVKKLERSDASDRISDADYVLPDSEKQADAKRHANLQSEFSFNKRFLNRIESGIENGKRPRTSKEKRSEVENLAFKKRIMRGESPRSTILVRVPKSKPVVPVRKTETDGDVKMEENPSESKPDVPLANDGETKVEPGKRPPDKNAKSMETTTPKHSKTSNVPRLRSSPPLRSSTPKASRSSPPPLRSMAVPSNTAKSSKSTDAISLPSRSPRSNPTLGNPKTPPALRSVAMKKDLMKTGSSSTSKIPSKSISASPPPRLTQTPPLTSRAGTASRNNPLRSKPVGQFESRSSNSSIGNLLPHVNGKGAEMNLDVSGAGTSSSDILAARLEGFYSQSKTGDIAMETASPRIAGKPQPILGQGHARYTRIPSTTSPSPRGQGHTPKYRGGPGPWRSFDGALGTKPLSSSPSLRMGAKGKNDNRIRNAPNGNGKAGSSTDTTAWSRYRKQNGWDATPSTKHVGYREPGGPGSQEGKGGSGRRRPYG